MTTQLYIKKFLITTIISEHSVHVICDKDFENMMIDDPVANTQWLVDELFAHFKLTQKRNLQISNNSLIVEIWCHYYFRKFFVTHKKKKWHLYNRFMIRLDNSTKRIDCGEWGNDTNRLVWDLLAPFKNIFRFFIQKKLPGV